jgi:hypothetical protein
MTLPSSFGTPSPIASSSGKSRRVRRSCRGRWKTDGCCRYRQVQSGLGAQHPPRGRPLMDAVWPVRLMGDWPKPLFVALLGLSPATLLPCLSQGHHRAALAVALRTRLASPTAALDAEANPVGRPSGIALAVRTSLTARAAVLGCRCRSLGSILWQAQATAPGVACATAARSDVNSTRAGACVQPAPRADNKSCRGQRSSAAAASSRPLSARSHLGAGVCVLCEGCLSAAARARPGPFPGREGNTPRLRKKVRSSRAGSCCCMLLAAGREKRELLAACPRAGWPRARARARPPWPPPPPAGWCCCLLPARDDPPSLPARALYHRSLCCLTLSAPAGWVQHVARSPAPDIAPAHADVVALSPLPAARRPSAAARPVQPVLDDDLVGICHGHRRHRCRRSLPRTCLGHVDPGRTFVSRVAHARKLVTSPAGPSAAAAARTVELLPADDQHDAEPPADGRPWARPPPGRPRRRESHVKHRP